MPDHALSAHPAVQAQLDRLWRLGPGDDILGLERITALLARLGDPHRHLPPVFHVAGTNGKGSTCAYLRAAIEAAGYRAHVYSSPHLVRFNERIRLAGQLIDDDALAALLSRVLDQADGIGASFFEVTTAAAFLAFAETPADACIVEVGLGGRLDATNVIAAPAVTGIAALGMDHEAFLGDTLGAIAGEKAGIAKRGVPLVTLDYTPPIAARIAEVATVADATLLARGRNWTSEAGPSLRYRDANGELDLPLPALPGAHQAINYALAVAMLRHQRALPIGTAAIAAAATGARWPGRLQRLGPGPLTARLAATGGIWIDGAHNPSAAAPVAAAWRAIAGAGGSAVVLGVLANKDAGGVIAALARATQRLIAVPVPGHAHHAPEALAALARDHGLVASTAADPAAALNLLGADPPGAVLIAGSLYLVGEVLRTNDELPD
jgi:dihydrofolate synthase/folylpolyglutamate synthase